MWFRVVLLGFVGLWLVVPAAVASSDSPFASWTNLASYMRLQGLEPTQIDWFYVEQLCAPSLQDGLEVFNRCKYQKAELSALHQNDQSECEDVADAVSHEPVSRRRVVSRYISPNRGLVRVVSHLAERPGLHQRNRVERAEFIGCMRGLGWASANDWRLGLR